MNAIVYSLLVCTLVCCGVESVPAKNGGLGSKWWGLINTTDVDPAMDRKHQSSSIFKKPASISQHRHHNQLRSNRLRDPSQQLVTAALYNSQYNRLHKKQRRLVTANDGVLPAVDLSLRRTLQLCQHEFSKHRWNCPWNGRSSSRRVFGSLVLHPTRETAFLYALSTAAVTHTIARGCARGTIQSCSCGSSEGPQFGTFRTGQTLSVDWQWGGCSDDVQFGYWFSRQFVDAGERGNQLRGLINMHNNEAGRKAVVSGMTRQCKCHGMSGSCAVKTCWKQLSTLETTSGRLKRRFDHAKQVYSEKTRQYIWQSPPQRNRRGPGFSSMSLRQRGRQQQLRLLDPNSRRLTKKDLVYSVDSPDFCDRNLRLGLPGTKGRQCNDTSQGSDGCDALCCGRGFHTRVREQSEPCRCEFKWCCEVKCQTCRVTKIEHFCL